jgi:hypothetical protein
MVYIRHGGHARRRWQGPPDLPTGLHSGVVTFCPSPRRPEFATFRDMRAASEGPIAMNKYGCTMVSSADIFYARVVAGDPK